MAESKVWFITGSSSGFGRLMVEHALAQGHRVVATLCEPEALNDLVSQYPSDRLIVVQLDVIQQAEISAAFAKAQEAFGRVDVVFNNAGTMYGGESESVKQEDMQEMFETNFWGAANVSLEAVRFFREVNEPQGGRLLQVSSGMAILNRACYGYYGASKAALEGFTEALAREVSPAWNIKITILQPGPCRTDFMTAKDHVAPAHPAYTDPELRGSKWRVMLKRGSHGDGDPQKMCVAFEKASRLEDPPLRLPLHRRLLAMVTEKANGCLDAVDKYQDWSDDLYL